MFSIFIFSGIFWVKIHKKYHKNLYISIILIIFVLLIKTRNIMFRDRIQRFLKLRSGEDYKGLNYVHRKDAIKAMKALQQCLLRDVVKFIHNSNVNMVVEAYVDSSWRVIEDHKLSYIPEGTPCRYTLDKRGLCSMLKHKFSLREKIKDLLTPENNETKEWQRKELILRLKKMESYKDLTKSLKA